MWAVTATASAASSGLTVSELPNSRCAFDEVVARELADLMRKESAIEKRGYEHLKKLSQTGDTTTTDSAVVKARLQTNKIAQLTESRRQRDLKLLTKLAGIVVDDYEHEKQPEENEADYYLYSMMQILSSTLKNLDITHPIDRQCSVEVALHAIETPALEYIQQERQNINSAAALVRALQQKYKMDALDTSALASEDRQLVLDLRNSQKPLLRATAFLKQIESLKVLERASVAMYQFAKADIAFSGGDEDTIGKTLKMKADNDELDANTQLAIGFWVAMDKQYPSAASEGAKVISDTLQRKSEAPLRSAAQR